MANIKISPDQKTKLIASIREGRFSDKELLNLYDNAAGRGDESILDIIKVQMRADFPKAASRKFGAKEAEAIARLETVLSSLPPNLNGNRLKNGVKAGSQMLAGEKHIDVYVSYKNKANVGVFLGLLQDTPSSELVARVGYYKTGDGAFRDEELFAMDDFDKAVDTYKANLLKVGEFE